jgi:Response regulators consisting of a CheY-like receiver domain and a winged-helix DNA-binding domain
MVGSKQLRGAGHSFCWIGADDIPSHLDLRTRAWKLDDARLPGNGVVGIIDGRHETPDAWLRACSSYDVAMRRSIIVADVESTEDRAMLIDMGFGDALSPSVHLDEVASRACRLLDLGQWTPRWRHLGELELDLVARDACVRGRPLSLNAREFTLLWRLADDLNRTVTKQDLIRDVWRMAFVPRTNSVAVHVSRLRSKLASAGFGQIIETVPEGGYMLRAELPHRFAPPPPQSGPPGPDLFS